MSVTFVLESKTWNLQVVLSGFYRKIITLIEAHGHVALGTYFLTSLLLTCKMRRSQCVFHSLLGGKFCVWELEVTTNMLLEKFPIFQYFFNRK